jgi:hypothetical protein
MVAPILCISSLRLASTLERLSGPKRACDWPELDQLLPDGGLPHAVVEITCSHAFYAGATRIAVAAVRAVHGRDPKSWCAWIDSDCTLFAPGLAQAGIDLGRLLVVRPARESCARVTVKVSSSGAFDVVVVELPPMRAPSGEKLVRKLALACEKHGTSIVLLTPPHADTWPVALRLEVARTEDGLDVRITKDRFGRVPTRLAKTHVPISEPLRGVGSQASLRA